MTPRTRHARTTLLVALLVISACAQNPSPAATPQARIASHAATLLNAVTELQKGVTAAATASPAFVPAAKQYTDVAEKIHTRSGPLGDALRAYDAAVTLDLRNVSEIQVQMQIAAINVLLVEAFNIKIDDATASGVAALVANVAKVVATLSAELAKSKTTTQ